MTLRSTIGKSLFLLACALLCASCSGGTDSSQGGSLAPLPSQASPPKDPAAVKRLLDTVEQGDPDASAHALVEVAPDWPAVDREYAGLIRLAESATGEMKLDVLYDACTGYHRWHSVVIEHKERGKAILEWMSQKIWEMPSGKEKSALVARFFDDLGRLIDAGKLPAGLTLDLARKTVAWDDIRPDALGAEYFRLLKRYATAKDPVLRDIVRDECRRFPPVCFDGNDEAKRVFEFVRQSFPGTKVFNDADEFYTFHLSIQGVDVSISRREYDAIPLLEPEQWTLAYDQRTDVHRSLGTMKYLLDWMLDRYDTAPDAVNRTIETWLRDIYNGPYEYGYLGDCLEGPRVYGPATNKSHPIELPEGVVDTFVNSLVEQNGNKDLDRDTAGSVHDTMNRILKALAKRDNGACSPKTVAREKLVLESQFNSIFEWERKLQKKPSKNEDYIAGLGDYYWVRLRVDFPENQALYCPEAKQFLKDKAQALLKDKSTYSDLAEPAQARIERMLADIVAMP